MRWLRRLAYWRRFGAEQNDLREEIAGHRELIAADLERRGLPPDAAHDAARRAMGNETFMREQARNVWLAPALDGILQDWKYAWRGLRRSPAFAVVAITSLALGIGANTAIFSLIHGLLLARLPVPAAKSLVMLKRDLGAKGTDDRFSRDEFRALSAGPLPVAMFATTQAAVEIGGVALTVSAEAVDERYFGILELRAAHGRLISPVDDASEAPVVVLTERFWRGRMGGDASVLGRTIKIAGQPFTVIGVTPDGFAGLRFPAIADVFVPFRSAVTLGLLRGANDRRQMLTIVARRRPSQTVDDAQRELAGVWTRCCAQGALVASQRGQPALVSTLTALDASRGIPQIKLNLRGEYSRVLIALMAGVGVLLLAACANVASLLLARNKARSGELAMRLALGASRSRLAAQLVIESLQLSALGAVAGVLLARWGVALLTRERIGDLSSVVDAKLGPTVLVFTIVVSAGAGVVFGLVPAIRVMRADLVTPLQQAGRRAAAGHGSFVDRCLVALQVALAVLLVSGATLLVQTLRNLQEASLGFDPSRRLVVTVETRRTSYERQGMTAQLTSEMLRRVRAIPGVRSAAFASLVPVYGGRTTTDNVSVPGGAPPADGDPSTYFVGVTPDYFGTLGIPLIAGRDIGPPIGVASRGVVRDVVVNDLFARKFFANRSPIGLTFRDADEGDTAFTENRVVGVVGAVKFTDVRSPARPMYYVPIADGDWPFLALVMRAPRGYASIAAEAGGAIAAVAPGIGRGDASLLEQAIDGALARERIAATLAGLFGIIALSLVAVGLYGVMLFQVTERTREIGIRIALGARAGAVVSLVLRQSLAIVAIGLAGGIPLALLAGRLVGSQLYGVEPYSVWALAVATIGLLSVAVAACLVPVRRAVGIDPLTALRSM